ncbi:hypothetical protein TSUD_382050 [Trifolium subterraneum]|uniref:Uncharacterized protein n=1 Tax=Trifolium subterraneum TaxID=3900 RepID=A0A2Z6NMB7_TRISU|nr:hypothetical protein TSUD_382050 [Trifolium subterraneum]
MERESQCKSQVDKDGCSTCGNNGSSNCIGLFDIWFGRESTVDSSEEEGNIRLAIMKKEVGLRKLNELGVGLVGAKKINPTYTSSRLGL